MCQYVCMFPRKGSGKKKSNSNENTYHSIYTLLHTRNLREIMMILELKNKTKLNLVDVLSESKEKLKTNVDT